ncbi:F-box/LRR-repeat protein At3g03360-like [Hordeum vulgare subsp. vulgare]|uniref:Uncharacterized protein n=1 Tax=Hordeum vulgare subsp. vulgare TaxID=112509 RepID=M0UMN5_HORVV|nr:F-box/LRR-repeat protein At3g03360-like [Hordeum vulgare subsp. vulgare]
MHLSIKSTLIDKRSRMQKQKVATMQLQLLPYDILCNILSRLSIKDVVRMSMLSHDWRQERICHPDLVFTKDTFGISIDPDLDFTKDVSGINTDLNTNRACRTAEFIANVDSVLRPPWTTTNTTTTMLDKFAVEYGLRRKHQYHIDRWVSFFIASRAKHIAFDFTSDINCSGSRFDKYMYVFPLRKLSGPNASFVKYLDLRYVWLKLPPSFGGITNLKKLTLNMVSINGVDLQRLLRSCALLESINIEWCSSFSSLHIRQELCRLQCMRVRHCKLEIMELHALSLKKIEFDDSLTQIVLGECSKLSDATFVSNRRASDFDDYGFDFTFTELPTALPHVQKLVILLNVDQMLRFSENQITSFTNLRHMNMNFEIGWDPYDGS